jgi:hypothetical protein
MPTPAKFKAPFRAQSFYHIVIKSIDGLLLFQHPGQKELFVERYNRFMAGVFDTCAYILLTNHAHFIVQVHPQEAVQNYIRSLPAEERTKSMQAMLLSPSTELFLNEVIERQINRLLVSFSTTFNIGSMCSQDTKQLELKNLNHIEA